MYSVRKLKIGRSDLLDALAKASGELYSRTVVSFWRTVKRQDHWLKPAAMMRWQNSKKLHAHSADASVQSFYSALDSWRTRRKEDPKAKPPRKQKHFYKIQWKSGAIKIKDGSLTLANGRGNEPLVIPGWRFELPKLVEVGWDGRQYELRACYLAQAKAQALGTKVAGVDLGEIHIAAAYDGERSYILNGRALRSMRCYQNKLKGFLSWQIDIRPKGSHRRRRWIVSKHKQLARLQHQILDLLHKQTTRLVSTLWRSGVQTVVIGDLRDIRLDLDYGPSANQSLHQWCAGKTRHMLEYKCARLGMATKLQDEAYTSQDCPRCGARHKPNGRKYLCRSCGFACHRDVVGAANIRAKYLGTSSPVVGAMASPIGLRFRPQQRCSA